MAFVATPVATPAEEQMTGLPFPIYPTGFETLLHPDPSSWSPKDFISPMNRICVDNTPLSSLGNISRETWVKTSNFLGDENAFSLLTTYVYLLS